MKLKILLFISIAYINIFAFDSQKQTDFYLNSRAITAEGLHTDDLKENSMNEALLRIGIRHRRTLNESTLFDVDLRTVFEAKDIRDKKDRNLYFEVKRFSLEFPLLYNNLLYGKIGRMSFQDKRTWWYDNELDVIKLSHDETLFSWDIAAGGRLNDNRVSDSDQRVGLKDSRYLISHIDYHHYFGHHLEFFGIYEDTKGNAINDEHKLGWLGVRSYGTYENIEYWTDLAMVSGDVSPVDNLEYSIRGYGFDLGAIYRGDIISLGVDFAYGLGDTSDNDSKKLYLQPKISNNKSSMLGKTRYRYYGELVDPELSNLKIFSIFAGLKILQNNWIETAYHNYQQDKADTRLSSSKLLLNPNGISKDIGYGFDIVVGGKYDDRSELQIVFSSFMGGDAFADTVKKEAYRAHIDYKLYW